MWRSFVPARQPLLPGDLTCRLACGEVVSGSKSGTYLAWHGDGDHPAALSAGLKPLTDKPVCADHFRSTELGDCQSGSGPNQYEQAVSHLTWIHWLHRHVRWYGDDGQPYGCVKGRVDERVELRRPQDRPPDARGLYFSFGDKFCSEIRPRNPVHPDDGDVQQVFDTGRAGRGSEAAGALHVDAVSVSTPIWCGCEMRDGIAASNCFPQAVSPSQDQRSPIRCCLRRELGGS
jgi:hypothetical protein